MMGEFVTTSDVEDVGRNYSICISFFDNVVRHGMFLGHVYMHWSVLELIVLDINEHKSNIWLHVTVIFYVVENSTQFKAPS